MDIPTNLKQELIILVPAAVINDISCFVLYDHHPKDDKNIDITICTKSGELREYFQRDIKSSLKLDCVMKTPTELRILRNNNSDLYYVLASNDKLFIISSKNKLQIERKLNDIDRYDFVDPSCSGETTLKVIKKDDAVPILFDSNFETKEDYYFDSSEHNEEFIPAINELRRKLVEARYSTECNEQTYAQHLILHQKVLLLCCKNEQYVLNKPVFRDDINNIGGVLNLKTHKPWVKVCNKRLVLMFNVLLLGEDPIKNIHILLHNETMPSLAYTSRIFTETSSPPYWHEPNTTQLEPGQEIIIAAVVMLNEVVQNMSRVELSGSIAYSLVRNGFDMEFLVHFDDVVVPYMEMMADEIDVLASGKLDGQTIPAILASTEKTELCFRHIKNDDDASDTSLPNLFCTHLQMDRVENAPNVIVYNKSPYHALNGIMMVFQERNSENGIPVSVHTRSSAQVTALLHHIYDTIPTKIIATTPSYKITAKDPDFSNYNEEILPTNAQINYKEYASSMLDRSAKILEYLDASIVKMNQSKNAKVRNNIGQKIDLFANGIESFKEFKENLMTAAKKGLESLTNLEVAENNGDNESDTDSDVMIIE